MFAEAMSALQAGGSLIGGLMGSNAASDAAKAQSEAASAATGELRQARFAAQKEMAPYRAIGGAANARLAKLLGLDVPQYRTLADGRTVEQAAKDQWDADYAGDVGGMRSAGNADRGGYEAIDPSGYQTIMNHYIAKIAPTAAANNSQDAELMRNFGEADLAADVPYQTGLQFGLDQGTRAINERAIAGGGYDSGATLKALTRFGNDYGSQKAGEAYNRFTGRQNQRYGMLSGQQGVGMGAASTTANQGMQSAGAVGELMTQQGNAAAAGRVGQANAWSNAFGGIGSAVQGYQNNQILNRLLENRRGSGGTPWMLNNGSYNPDN